MASIARPPAVAIAVTWIGPPALQGHGLAGLAVAALLAAVILAAWIRNERQSARRRANSQALYQAAEQIAGLASYAEIAARLSIALSKLGAGIRAAAYVFNRSARSLDALGEPAGGPPVIQPEYPEGGIAAGVALSYRNRTLITIPDTRRSPFFDGERTGAIARSMTFVPMFAQEELVGVLQVAAPFPLHQLSEEEHVALQHLANQAATAIRLQQQRTAREQLFQTEKLAVSGHLLSGVAAELRPPLGAILAFTAALKVKWPAAREPEVELIEGDALRALEIVSRLIAFGRTDRTEAQPVDIHALLARLLRPGNGRASGADIQPSFLPTRILVLGSQQQLEQVFVTLLAYAEQNRSGGSAITIATSLLARRVLIEVGFPIGPEARIHDPFENGGGNGSTLGFSLSRGILQSHGGDLRFVKDNASRVRLEVELPVSEVPATEAELARGEAGATRKLTALSVDAEAKTLKQIVEILSKRGDRVVPIGSAEEAAHIVQRLRFDVVFCPIRLAGLNWVDLFERVRRHIGAFVLLTHGNDADLAKAFHDNGGFVLSKPIDEASLNRICDAVAERMSV